MSRKPKQQEIKFAAFEEVIQVALTPDLAERVVTYLVDVPKLYEQFMALSEMGCAVSLRPTERGMFAASIQVLSPSNGNKGRMVYGNAPSRAEAIAVLFVKLDFLGWEGDWALRSTSSPTSAYF